MFPPFIRRAPALLALFAAGFGCIPVRAGLIDSMLERIQRSEFVFGQAETNVPFLPVALLGVHSYGDSELTLAGGRIGFREFSASQMLLAPVWVGQKDMILLGESVTWQRLSFGSPFTARRDITSVMPLAAWLRQTGPKSQLGLYLAPEFVDGGSYAGYELNDSTLYTGLLCTRQGSDRLMWIYGGVAFFTDGANTLLPYAGLLWHPNAEWSLSVVAPWPSLTYAPSRDFMVQFGLGPAGAQLSATRDGRRLRVGYDSWNLTLAAHRRISRSLWLSAGAGWSGFGSFSVSSGGNSTLKTDLDRGPVWSVQLALRPAQADRAAPPPTKSSPR